MSDAVVVAGATGFLGRHTLAALDREVVACVRRLATWHEKPWSEPRGVRVVETPLELAAERLAPLGRARAVLHLAGLVRHSRHAAADLYAANVEGTLHAVRLAARLGARLVVVSTSGTVGCFRDAALSADEDAPYCEATVRRWPYYHSKIIAEQRARSLAAELGVELTVVRPPILLGPDDHGGRSTGHVRRFLEGRLPFLVHGGIQVVDVRDVASALRALVDITTPHATYHLAGYAGTVVSFFSTCAAIAGGRVPPPVPYWLARGAAGAAEALCPLVGRKSPLPEPVVVEMARHYWNVHSRVAHELGFVARPLETTLDDTIASLRAARAQG